MNKTRVIPVLLLRGKGLVKTVKFKEPKYIGDPINSVRIFNEKEVDEVVFLDITATPAAVAELDRQLGLNEAVMRTKVTRPAGS